MKNEKGFTLIELLVVIGIIGILSGIVLVNVNSARDKAKDAAIKGAIGQARLVAEIHYDDNSNSYATLCASAEEGRIDASAVANGGTYVCNNAAAAYCMSSTLNGGGAICVDATGATGSTVCGAATVCP